MPQARAAHRAWGWPGCTAAPPPALELLQVTPEPRARSRQVQAKGWTHTAEADGLNQPTAEGMGTKVLPQPRRVISPSAPALCSLPRYVPPLPSLAGDSATLGRDEVRLNSPAPPSDPQPPRHSEGTSQASRAVLVSSSGSALLRGRLQSGNSPEQSLHVHHQVTKAPLRPLKKPHVKQGTRRGEHRLPVLWQLWDVQYLAPSSAWPSLGGGVVPQSGNSSSVPILWKSAHRTLQTLQVSDWPVQTQKKNQSCFSGSS